MLTKRLQATLSLCVAVVTLPVLAACTSFGTVRSAVVHPGPSVTLQASMTTPPGDEAAWFWSYDCPTDCNRSIVASEAGITMGFPARNGGPSFALGAGVSGVYPWLDGYVQLNGGDRPFGLGARLGWPSRSFRWYEHQLYGRYDIVLDSTRRIVWNPSLFYHAGHGQNGQTTGRVIALVQGVGLALERSRMTVIPSASLALARGRRTFYGDPPDRFTAVFLVLAMNVTFHGR